MMQFAVTLMAFGLAPVGIERPTKGRGPMYIPNRLFCLAYPSGLSRETGTTTLCLALRHLFADQIHLERNCAQVVQRYLRTETIARRR